jgi:hypothetical protein
MEKSVRLKQVGAAIFVILLVVVAAPRSASAATLVLTLDPNKTYQQTAQNPCVFTNPSCNPAIAPVAANPATISGSTYGQALPNQGNVTSWDQYVTFDASQLLALDPDGNLMLGFDINDTSVAQSLLLFEMYIGGVKVDTYTGSAGNVLAPNNGTGFADYLMTGFSSIANVGGTTDITFRFQFANANDGAENVFLISTNGTPTNPVPEPATMLLLARRRKAA